MTIYWKNIATRLEIGLIFLCYVIGIGSILFGSLLGSSYGYHFIIIGVLAPSLVILHTRTDQYDKNARV